METKITISYFISDSDTLKERQYHYERAKSEMMPMLLKRLYMDSAVKFNEEIVKGGRIINGTITVIK